MIGLLPQSLTVDGIEYPINSDFRAALLIMEAYDDSKLSPLNKQLVMLEVLYTPIISMENPKPKANIPPNVDEALMQAIWFLDVGMDKSKEQNQAKTIDYVKDEQLIFSAVNAVYSKDVRAEKYMHWWTFYGLCQAIDGESLIANIASIRQKKAEGKKLEKFEQQFYKENIHLIELGTSKNGYDEMVRQLRR